MRESRENCARFAEARTVHSLERCRDAVYARLAQKERNDDVYEHGADGSSRPARELHERFL